MDDCLFILSEVEVSEVRKVWFFDWINVSTKLYDEEDYFPRSKHILT